MPSKTTAFCPLSIVIILLVLGKGTLSLAQKMPVSPSNQLTLPAQDYEIVFQWAGDTINSRWEPYASLLIPVTLPHCPRLFYMQFDLGSPYTMFYRNKLKAIQDKYPKVFAAKDSLTKLTDFEFKVGNENIVAKEMVVQQYDESKINWKRKNSMEVIGTIGVDLIDQKALVIDYPGKKLFVGAAVPSALASRTSLIDFFYAGKRILLPAVVKDKKTILYFDTGSSAFELLTDKETSLSLAQPGAVAAQYPVKSWDKVMQANTLPSTDSVTIAGEKIPVRFVTYMDGVSDSQVKQMMKMGIGGMTGNKLFLNSILLLDTATKKFGMITK